VTSPQELVSMIVEKAVKMAELMNIPVIGIVENMSYFVCDECGKTHYLFGKGKTEKIAEKYGINNVLKLPIDSELAKSADGGQIEFSEVSGIDDFVKKIVQ
jgi:Mrp family chromosome partitioning ATPase